MARVPIPGEKNLTYDTVSKVVYERQENGDDNAISIAGAALVTDPNTINMIDSTTTAGYTYFGTAPLDSLFTAVVWTVRKMDNATGSIYPSTGGALTAWSQRAGTTTYNTGS